MESKFIGKVYDGYEVVTGYLKNTYEKNYKDSKPKQHRAYNYVLVNYEERKSLTLSGNQLRLINNGTRSIADMLNSNARGSKNKQLYQYIKENNK